MRTDAPGRGQQSLALQTSMSRAVNGQATGYTPSLFATNEAFALNHQPPHEHHQARSVVPLRARARVIGVRRLITFLCVGGQSSLCPSPFPHRRSRDTRVCSRVGSPRDSLIV